MDNITSGKSFGYLIALVFVLIVITFPFAWIAMALWNNICVPVFGWSALTFWQTYGLMLLIRILAPSRIDYKKND